MLEAKATAGTLNSTGKIGKCRLLSVSSNDKLIKFTVWNRDGLYWSKSNWCFWPTKLSNFPMMKVL